MIILNKNSAAELQRQKKWANSAKQSVNLYFQAVNAFRNIFQVHVRACFVAFALFVGLSFSSISQEVNPKVKALNEKAWEYLYADIDSAIYFANQAIQSAQKKDKYSLGAATCRLAVAYDINGDFEQALKYYLESLVYLKSYGASRDRKSVV